MAYGGGHFDSGTGPIHLDGVTCTGSESRLLDCSYGTDTSEDSHSEDVGVRCLPGKCSMSLFVYLLYSSSTTL